MKLFFKLTLIFFFNVVCSQKKEKHPPNNIKTIILKELNSERQNPIIELNKVIEFSFDDINGDEADYYYKIEHYNFDWKPSILSKNEYLKGIDNQHIQEYENSFNTLQIYSHFKLQIPNNDVAITKTGNYFLEIYNDSDELVFTKKFIVYKKESNVAVEIKRSRDLNHINQKQVVQFKVEPRKDFFINPKKNINILVFKNNNINNAITNLIPQYTIGKSLIYRYDKEASFWAGNEFFNFDNKNIRGGNINIRTFYLNDLYHNKLYTNTPRKNNPYTYNPDINGGFITRNLNTDNSHIEADYVKIHFSLSKINNIENKKIYVIGNFNNYILNENSEMKFNPKRNLYENISLIKQGFVNYKYISVEKNKSENSIIDGDFYQTENEYTVLVYYKKQGDRYTKVIGIGHASSVNISN